MKQKEKIFKVKVIRDGGSPVVQCPVCLNKYAGRALEPFLMNKIPMPCRDKGDGCEAILELFE